MEVTVYMLCEIGEVTCFGGRWEYIEVFFLRDMTGLNPANNSHLQMKVPERKSWVFFLTSDCMGVGVCWYPPLSFKCWRPYSLSQGGALTLFLALAIAAPFYVWSSISRALRFSAPLDIITNQPYLNCRTYSAYHCGSLQELGDFITSFLSPLTLCFHTAPYLTDEIFPEFIHFICSERLEYRGYNVMSTWGFTLIENVGCGRMLEGDKGDVDGMVRHDNCWYPHIPDQIPALPSVYYLASTNLAFLCLACGIPSVTTFSVAGPPLGRKIERKGALPPK